MRAITSHALEAYSVKHPALNRESSGFESLREYCCKQQGEVYATNRIMEYFGSDAAIARIRNLCISWAERSNDLRQSM